MVTNHILSHINVVCITPCKLLFSWDVLWKMLLSITLGGSPEVICCVASQTSEDFTSPTGDAPLDNISLNNGTNGAQNGWTNNDKSRTITSICGGTTPTLIPSWCHVKKIKYPIVKKDLGSCMFIQRKNAEICTSDDETQKRL